MAFVSPRMSLKIWNAGSDPYDHEQLGDNWRKLDLHDHSQGRGTLIRGDGIAEGSITTVHIYPGSIGADALGVGSIGTDQLADGSVTQAKLANLGPVVDLPANPIDGAEVVWTPDGAGMGAAETPYWRMKWSEADLRWWNIGGVAARTLPFARNDQVTSAPGTNQFIPAGQNVPSEWLGGWRFTIPKAGTWLFRATCTLRFNVTGTVPTGWVSFQFAVRDASFAAPFYSNILAGALGQSLTCVIDGVTGIPTDAHQVWLSHESSVQSPAATTILWNESANMRFYCTPVKVEGN